MSMKKLTVLAALQNYGGLNRTEMNPTPGSPPAPVHGVNVMLGGAMISGIILVVFIFCYCCHKTHRKSAQTHLPTPYWREPTGLSMEIYTVEAQSCFSSEEFIERNGEHHHQQQRAATPGPPPAYDVVVPIHKDTNCCWTKEERNCGCGDDVEPPSYETAIKLTSSRNNGFV